MSITNILFTTNNSPSLTGTPDPLPHGAENAAYTLTLADLLSGYSDADDDTLNVSALSALHGKIADNGDGTFTVTPAAYYSGDVTLSYTVFDGKGGTAAATRTVAFDAGAAISYVGQAETRINTYTTGAQYSQKIAKLSDGSYVVTWMSNGQDGAAYGIYAQHYDAAGVAQGGEVRVNTYTAADQAYPQIAALAAGGYVVTWMSNGQDGNNYGVYAQRYDNAGTAQGGEVLVNTYRTSHQAYPQVAALLDGGYVVTWQSGLQDASGTWGVYAQRYDAAGGAVGAEFRVNTYTASDQDSPRIKALTDGGYVITWESRLQDGSGYGIYAQRFNAAGTAVGGEIHVSTTAAGDQLMKGVTALAGGGYVVTWIGVEGAGYASYAQAFDSSNTAVGGERHLGRLHVSTQGGASVMALADGGYVLAYEDDASASDTLHNTVYIQRYNAAGAATSAATAVDGNSTNQLPTIAALSDGGFVVVSHIVTTNAQGWDLYVQRFDAAGAAVGGAVLVNSFTAGDQVLPVVVALDGGGFVVTWESDGQDGADAGLYQKVFLPDHLPQLTGAAASLAHATEDVAYTVNASDLLAGYTDSDGGALTVTRLTANHGTVTDNHDGTYTVTPAADYVGTMTLSYGVTDTLGGTASVTATYVVDNVNDGPRQDALIGYLPHGAEDTAHTIGGFDLLSSFYDPDGDSMAVTSLSVDHGSVVLNGDGTITITPDADFFGDMTLSYTLIDGHGGTLGVSRTVTFDEVIDTVTSSVTATLADWKENLVLNGWSNVNGTGNALANRITGNSHNNVLDGKGGADTMIGGSGDDTYYIDNAGDVVVEKANQGNDTIHATVSVSLAGTHVEMVLLDGHNNINVTANGLANTVTGNDGSNVLDGGNGNDSLDGGAGADTLIGGAGNDTFYVDNADDVVTEAWNQGADVVHASVSYTLGTYVETLILDGSGDINGTGSVHANTLLGNDGSNILDGGRGNDILTGGRGADTFVFSAKSGADTITDFTNDDTINLHAYSHGNAHASWVVQSGGDVVITLTGGNTVTVTNAAVSDVLAHVTW